MGRSTGEGESPVSETEARPAGSRVRADTRNLPGRRGDHPPSLPIEEQYCEGKVKRTPGGE